MRRWRDGSRSLRLHILPIIFLVLGLVAGCSGGTDLSFPTEYQAVFLDNGQVFFGKLGDAGPEYLVLRDVYFIQRQVDQDKKETKNLLIRLGNEWHAPDFMRINSRHVILIEPVAPDSRVAQLIREAKLHPTGPPPATAAPPAAGAPPAASAPAPAAPPAPAVAPPAQTPPAAAPKRPAGR